MDNFENIITEIFTNEIQLKRIKKEFQQIIEQLKIEDFKISLKVLSPNLQIIIEMPPRQQLNQQKPIIFALYLDNRFPFIFPKLHILSQVTKPSLSDGRDYLQSILSDYWSPQKLLFQIIKMFPQFLDIIEKNQNNEDYLLKLGQYNVNSEFDIRIGLENVEYLECQQVINGKQSPITLLISDSYLLILEYQSKELMLLNYICMKNLKQIERVQSNLLLHYLQISDGRQIIQTLTSENVNQLYNSINSQILSQTVKKNHQDNGTLQKFETIEINELLQQMSQNEEELSKNLNKISLNNLMNSYQQAIEYYSVYSDEDYKKYVIRLQTLLGREDVLTIIASPVK